VVRNLIIKTQEYLNSRYPKREAYCKGVAYALISALGGNSLKTDESCPIPTKGNIFVLLCGPSNSGKSSIMNYGLSLLEKAQFRNILTEDTTPESMVAYFSSKPYALMVMDEFTKVIGSYKKKTYMAGLREALVKAYDGTTLVQTRSTRTIAEAKNYSMSAIVGTQPSVVAEDVGETDVSSGFLPRFNWFHVIDPVHVKPEMVSDDILRTRDELIVAFTKLHSISLHYEINFKFNVSQLHQIDARLSPHQHTENTHFQPFYERVTLFAYKYAMLYHFADPEFTRSLEETRSDGAEEDEWKTDQSTIYSKKSIIVDISNAAVSWAIDVTQEMLQDSMPKTLRILRLSESDKIIDAVRNYQERHNSPMAESLLYRAVAHVLKDPGKIKSAIEMAIKQDYIQLNRVQGGINYSLFGEYSAKKVESYVAQDDEDKIEVQVGNTEEDDDE